MKTLFTRYSVSWQFTNELCGSVPQNPDLVDRWLNAVKPTTKPPEARELSEIREEVIESLGSPTEEKQISVLGFQRHEGSGLLFVRGATIRAHLKDCARQLSRYVVGKVRGETSFAVRAVNTVYVEDEQVFISRSGEYGEGNQVVYVREPDGWVDKAFSAMTPMGPISAFKRYAFVTKPTLSFTLRILGGAISQQDLQNIMEYGGIHGYGGERGMGYGRYVIQSLEEIV